MNKKEYLDRYYNPNIEADVLAYQAMLNDIWSEEIAQGWRYQRVAGHHDTGGLIKVPMKPFTYEETVKRIKEENAYKEFQSRKAQMSHNR